MYQCLLASFTDVNLADTTQKLPALKSAQLPG